MANLSRPTPRASASADRTWSSKSTAPRLMRDPSRPVHHTPPAARTGTFRSVLRASRRALAPVTVRASTPPSTCAGTSRAVRTRRAQCALASHWPTPRIARPGPCTPFPHATHWHVPVRAPHFAALRIAPVTVRALTAPATRNGTSRASRTHCVRGASPPAALRIRRPLMRSGLGSRAVHSLCALDSLGTTRAPRVPASG